MVDNQDVYGVFFYQIWEPNCRKRLRLQVAQEEKRKPIVQHLKVAYVRYSELFIVFAVI